MCELRLRFLERIDINYIQIFIWTQQNNDDGLNEVHLIIQFFKFHCEFFLIVNSLEFQSSHVGNFSKIQYLD